MSDQLIRGLVIGGVVVFAVAVAALAGRWSRPSHPRVDLSGLTLDPGVVMFTSTDCSTCHEARTIAAELDVPVREVTHELEPAKFEAAGVVAVPLTVVVSAGGDVVAQFTGVPRRRALQRAARRAGW